MIRSGRPRVVLVQLDPDLMHGCLRLAVGNRPLLGDDRDRVDLLQERSRQVVDLGLRGLAAGEHAEVDADVAVLVDEGDRSEILHCKFFYPALKVL